MSTSTKYYDQCPCGSLKLRESKLCRECWKSAKVKHYGRKRKTPLCECGKPKCSARVFRCSACYHKYRRESPKHCRDCEVKLTSRNQSPNSLKYSHYICTLCHRKWQKGYNARNKERNTRRRIAFKIEVMSHYGNKCQCCGEQEIAFLTIDHVREDGNQFRKSRVGGLYNWLKAHKYPQDGFQCLCINCNWAKSKWTGGCPHQQKQTVAT